MKLLRNNDRLSQRKKKRISVFKIMTFRENFFHSPFYPGHILMVIASKDSMLYKVRSQYLIYGHISYNSFYVTYLKGTVFDCEQQ